MQAIPPLKAQAGTRGNLPDKLARLARSPFGQHYSSKSAGSYRKKGLSESSTLPQRHSAVGISNFGIPIRKLWLIGAALVLISLAVATTTYAAEVIVDDGDAGYADTGWSSATDQGYPLDPGMDVRFTADGDGSQIATWTPAIPATGPYAVYVSWTTHSNRATNAPYTINHAGGPSGFTVNQELLADQATAGGSGQWSDWYLAGTFTFNAGSSHTIVLNNNADEYVIADAVRLVSVSSDVSGRKFEDLDGNGVMNGSETGLEGWTIVAAESFQSFSVDSNDTVGMTSNVLANGEVYLVRVGGTYDAGDTITADAKYSVRPPNIYWTDSVQNYTSYGPELLDLQVDGVSPDWGPYNTGHVYWLNVLGAGAGLTFKVNDIGYPNVGSLTVDIYHAIAQTLTDVDGLYAMTGIPSANFIVAEIPQTGWLQTAPGGGFYAVSAAGAYANFDFGNQKTPSISGMKFDDTNGNGIKDPNDPGLPDWRIRMRDMTTNLVTTRDTDANGAYAFENLPPGQYRLTERQEDGWVETLPVSPNRYDVTLAQGQQETNKDFGNFKLFEIHGIKYEDVDGSGAFDALEPLLENWEITLTTPTTTLTAFTDSNGAYSFTGLGPGLYTLTETLQAGWGQSEPSEGSWDIEGQSGAVFEGANFGNYRFASIRGRKYRDDNFNGVRNAGDPYLGGWTIELTSLRDGTKQTAVTKANNPNKGSYAFTNLRPGSYLVREMLQRGWMPVNPAMTYHRVTVISDQALEDVNFGNNTIRNYAIWRISNPSSFVSPLTIQGNQAVVPQFEEAAPQEGDAAVPPNPPSIDVPHLTPPTPPELPKVPKEPPVNGREIARKVLESIKRWLPNNF
ncbi:hypothetical protein A3B36_01080 [Candidatus Uhrbacteria bacterium RIFCSPLOWO2_01_FULL_55_36]|uniref:SD-repeat containing protein B domain-containing protein n=1 Tax=Candidatus Uhrbacteria bacterium RIFCSPLOWO2_01_FULL_55_36 TaxID=1802404 RepID=A0A1F7UZK0_9BACT|nr:MAG: hypothetical protein A3B36_01080 [Candidatus Uhrbacteria bacterium RIFCSPLOWO2_01_FULL_55_36]